MKSKQNLIVTGAGGRIGRLVRLCAETENYGDFSIRFTERRAIDPALRWDLTSAEVQKPPTGEILLHLAAVLPGRGLLSDLQDNVAMAQAVVRADRAAHYAHVVFVSTVAVYAPQDAAIDEAVPPAPPGLYGQTKWQAEQILAQALGERLTVLRLANLAGADALLGQANDGRQILLDPVPDQPRGPLRSYIGPLTLARTIGDVMTHLCRGGVLPPVVNLAQPGAVAMADLLDVSGRDWRFGPTRAEVIPKLEVDVTRLTALCPLPPASPRQLVQELADLKGRWP